MRQAEARRRLTKVVRSLVKRDDVNDRLAELKRKGRTELNRPDFLWLALVQSMATWGNANRWRRVDYDKISYNKLRNLGPRRRTALLDKTLRQAGVRMRPRKKPQWLSENLDKLKTLGGPASAKSQLMAKEGREQKMAFLRQFKGIGPKYARNIMMGVLDKDFLDSIAIDERIKDVSSGLGLHFDTGTKAGYERCERFYQGVADSAKVQPWVLDRIMFWFKDDVLKGLSR